MYLYNHIYMYFAVECDSDIFVLKFQLLQYYVYYPVN